MFTEFALNAAIFLMQGLLLSVKQDIRNAQQSIKVKKTFLIYKQSIKGKTPMQILIANNDK